MEIIEISDHSFGSILLLVIQWEKVGGDSPLVKINSIVIMPILQFMQINLPSTSKYWYKISRKSIYLFPNTQVRLGASRNERTFGEIAINAPETSLVLLTYLDGGSFALQIFIEINTSIHIIQRPTYLYVGQKKYQSRGCCKRYQGKGSRGRPAIGLQPVTGT